MEKQAEPTDNPAKPTSLDAARESSSRALGRVLLIGGVVVVLVAGVLLASSDLLAPKVATQPPPAIDDLCSPQALAEEPAGCVARENYLQLVRELRTQLNPQLDAISLASWSSDTTKRIRELDDLAVGAFDQADYTAAEVAMVEAVELAKQGLARAPEVLQEALATMVTAFNLGDTAKAQKSLTRASSIDASAPQVLNYDPRIKVLPQVLELLERAKVARIENRATEELVALTELVELDPQRKEHQGRIAEIARTQTEAAYSQAVARAEQAIQEQDVTTARKQMARAARIVPGRDLGFLRSRIEEIERNQRLNAALARASNSLASDDWKTAQAAFEDALAIDANHKYALEGYNDAVAIVAAKAKLSGYLAKPLRLASPRVAKFATQDVASFQPLLARSAGLRELDQSVQSYLRKAQQPVAVQIYSDGATDISVRRVGIVGKHKAKTIELTPGQYQFEGRRRGYKSALVELEIPFGVTEIEVRVVANERI